MKAIKRQSIFLLHKIWAGVLLLVIYPLTMQAQSTPRPWTEGFTANGGIPASMATTGFWNAGVDPEIPGNPGAILITAHRASNAQRPLTSSMTTWNITGILPTDTFSFNYRFMKGNNLPEAAPESSGMIRIFVSENNGASYTKIDSIIAPGNPSVWRNKKYTLSAYAGMSVKFKLESISAYGNSLLIVAFDNFKVYGPCTAPQVNLGNDLFICDGTTPSFALDAGNSGAAFLWNNGATTQTINAATPGSYWARVTRGPGCVQTDTLVIQPRPLPLVSLGTDTTICPNTILTLDAQQSNARYLWSNGDTVQHLNVNSPGSYHVAVTQNDCTGRDTINITAGQVPVDVLPHHADLCLNQTITLDAGTSAHSYLWSNGATTQTLVVDTPGLYHVTLTSTDACRLTSAGTEVISRPLPLVNLGADTLVCGSHNIVLLDAMNQGSRYLWSNGDTIQSIMVDNPGIYSVTVTSSFQCNGRDTIDIAYLDAAATNGFNFIPMFQVQPRMVQFEAIQPQAVADYTWDFGDGNTATQASPVHVYVADGIYTVRLTVNNFCGSGDTSLVISVNRETGISKLDRKYTEFEVYPNPATSAIKIAARTPGTEISNVILINSAGQSTSTSVKEGNDTYTLDVSQLNTGLYILCIYTKAGVVHKKINIIR